MYSYLILAFGLIHLASPLNPYHALSGVKMIIPEKVLKDIPRKIKEQIKKLDKDDDSLTTSYSFPPEYKTTIYKDYYKKTTLVNLYPSMKTSAYSPLYFDPGFQKLETSTTLLYEMLNDTVEYQTIPMLNSTLVYPMTEFVQTLNYATPEYQHEVLVFPTVINITELTSTKLANYTKVLHVDNELPFL